MIGSDCPEINLIKLDFCMASPHNRQAMQKTLHSESIRAALASRGWDQKKLAEAEELKKQLETRTGQKAAASE